MICRSFRLSRSEFPGIEQNFRLPIRNLIRGLTAPTNRIERRQDGRYPFPRLIELTPVDEETLSPTGQTLTVLGKDVSEHGFGFFSQAPIPFRRAVAIFPAAEGGQTAVLVDLSWCRFNRSGWYENGGRFLQLVDTPADAA